MRSTAFALRDGDKGQVADEEKGREHECHAVELVMAVWMEQACDHVGEDMTGLDEQVPTVQVEEPSEIDPEAAQHDGACDKEPAGRIAEIGPHRDVHNIKRNDHQRQAGPGKRGEQPNVEPERRAGIFPQMLKIGDDVRRVGEKDDPKAKGNDEQPPVRWIAIMQGGDEEAKEIGNPGQEQVPRKEAVGPEMAEIKTPYPDRAGKDA